jgi:hypothetical protein
MRFVSDSELVTLTPAERGDTASPIRTQVVNNDQIASTRDVVNKVAASRR